MFEALSTSGSDCPSEPSASGASDSGLRAKAFEGDPTTALSKGKDDAFEGDPTAASSKGKDKGPTVDDMLSDDSGDDSNRVSSDFGSVSEGCGSQDPDSAAPLSKRSKVGLDNAKSWQLTVAEMADRLELEGVRRKKFRDTLKNHKRSRKRIASRHKHASDALASLSASYNKGKLRIGDMADPDWERRKQRPDHGRRAHPQAWSLSGTIELAFSSIGALSRNFTTRRSVDAIASVALAALAHQKESLRAWSRFCLPASGPCKWVCMSRSHDSTPIRIRFGQLRELKQVARFWCKQGKPLKGNKPAASTDVWKLHTWEDIQHTAGALPSHGIVELMAQRGCIAWPEQHGAFVAHQRRDLFFPPKFLQRTNGSTIFACMQQADPGLTFEKFFEMASFVDYLVVVVGSDLAASCSRAKHEVRFRCKQHNEAAFRTGQGVALFIDGQCAAHTIHREIEGHFATKELPPYLPTQHHRPRPSPPSPRQLSPSIRSLQRPPPRSLPATPLCSRMPSGTAIPPTPFTDPFIVPIRTLPRSIPPPITPGPFPSHPTHLTPHAISFMGCSHYLAVSFGFFRYFAF